MKSNLPAMLPPITSVEVVVLRGVDANRADQFMHDAADTPSVTLGGDEAQRIAELWRALPPGHQSRCHIPPFGLRFWSGERIVCEASLCWECDNIFGRFDGRDFHYEFDADAPASQALLAALRSAAGDQEAA